MKDAARPNLQDAEESGRQDAEAVARTLAGDLKAFDVLIERYQRRAVAVAYRLLGNIADAMDVCQDAYVRAFRSLTSMQDPARFGPWLMRIVSNLALNFRRDRKSLLSLTTDDDGPGVDAGNLSDERTEEGGSASGDSLQASELEQAINRAIGELPEKQRLALVLFAIEGLPQKEVAEILDCSLELVKWNVFQARKTLKDKLAEYLES